MHTVPPVPEGRFPTTHWSQVALAADLDPRVKREALGCLLREYLPAFEAHLRHVLRQPADRADDLLQGFVCDQVVAADLLADADRGRGRFRTFLLTALDRYVARVWRTETAGKRAPAGGIASVDDCSNLKSAALPASDAFDLAWARQVVTRALEQMRVECQQSGREQLWELFRCRTVAPLFDGTAAPRYQELVRRFGFESPSQASNALVTAKRMFARVLRSIVGEYSSGREEIERELTDLLDVFAKAHPRGASRELQSQ